MANITFLSPVRAPGVIGAITIDARLSESHSYSNEIPSFPVEEGVNISDHIRTTPEKISISGIITNYVVPKKVVVNTPFYKRESEGQPEKSTEKKKTLEAFKSFLLQAGYDPDRQPGTWNRKEIKELTVVSSLKTYSNMYISSMEFPVSPANGTSLYFNIDLVQVRTVRSAYSKINNPSNVSRKSTDTKKKTIADQTASKSENGTVTAEENTPARSSTLARGAESVGIKVPVIR